MSKELVQPSNTLILNENCQDFEDFKPFFRVIPLKKFKFSLLVYKTTQEAKQKYEFLQQKYALSYYLYTDLAWFNGDKISPTEFLSLPQAEKNFLISPPGDPPLGWTQDSEAKPSAGGFTVEVEEGRHHFIKTRSYSDLVDFSLDGDCVQEYDQEHVQEIVTFTNGGEALKLPLIVIDHVQGDTIGHLKKLKIPQTHIPPKGN
jgi:Calcipressin